MITNIPAPDHLDKLLCHLQCFFNENVQFSKILQRYIKELKLTVFLVLTE